MGKEIEEIKVGVGQKIREFRKLKNLTQKELAEKAGVSRDGVIKLEKGNLNFSIEFIYKISEVLDINVFDLLKIK